VKLALRYHGELQVV